MSTKNFNMEVKSVFVFLVKGRDLVGSKIVINCSVIIIIKKIQIKFSRHKL